MIFLEINQTKGELKNVRLVSPGDLKISLKQIVKKIDKKDLTNRFTSLGFRTTYYYFTLLK